MEIISINSTTLTIIVIANIFVFGTLIMLVLRQRNHIQQLEDDLKPRYGFLGKPLFTSLAVALMLGSFGLTYLIKQNSPDVSVTEEKRVEITIDYEVVADLGVKKDVKFKVIPKVDGKEWADDQTALFDAYWSFSGPEVFSEFESKLNEKDPGGFRRVLAEGDYRIRIDIVYLGKTWSKEFNLNF
ncbi:MAG: hypothetical protein JNK26_02080 [Candidatus Doudnabacteria bacterium]|nr:hypothetical protein [Candidatus Doudnabacteria bacterium]